MEKDEHHIGGRFEVKVSAESHFSWLRTRLSLERTLMSWIRTAISLIAFGFTIVQFFARLPEYSEMKPPLLPGAAWYFGLALIFCGVISLLVSLAQYRWGVRYLWSEGFSPLAGATQEGMHSSAAWVALALAAAGAVTFVAVLFRLV